MFGMAKILSRLAIPSCFLLILILITGMVAAQQPPPGAAQPPPRDQSKASGKGRDGDRRGPHAGAWLRRYQNLPPAEQERALNSDPQFRELPNDDQEKLRERLRQFNSFPPEKRQRILKRMEVFDHLSPEQQQHARDLFGRLRNVPEERRRVIKRTARNLRQFDAAERERLLNSDAYRNNFTDEERSLIRELAALDLDSAAAAHRSEQQRQHPE
jgi:hypothetical protein